MFSSLMTYSGLYHQAAFNSPHITNKLRREENNSYGRNNMSGRERVRKLSTTTTWSKENDCHWVLVVRITTKSWDYKNTGGIFSTPYSSRSVKVSCTEREREREPATWQGEISLVLTKRFYLGHWQARSLRGMEELCCPCNDNSCLILELLR